jgi:hypothetical protein
VERKRVEEEIFKALERNTDSNLRASAPYNSGKEGRRAYDTLRPVAMNRRKNANHSADSSGDEPKKKRKPLFDTSSDDYLGEGKFKKSVTTKKKHEKIDVITTHIHPSRSAYDEKNKNKSSKYKVFISSENMNNEYSVHLVNFITDLINDIGSTAHLTISYTMRTSSYQTMRASSYQTTPLICRLETH